MKELEFDNENYRKSVENQFELLSSKIDNLASQVVNKKDSNETHDDPVVPNENHLNNEEDSSEKDYVSFFFTNLT